MTKYVGAVLRKPYQLAIAAEIDHFENYHAVGKNTDHLGTQKKNETIYKISPLQKHSLQEFCA